MTRKITSNIARIKKEIDDGKEVVPFELGNINASRDWSDSEDFIEAVWLMLNQDEPREYVLSSNETHTIKEFIELACKYAGLDYQWNENGNDLDTQLYVNDKVIMKINEKYYRPAEVDLLYGDSLETQKVLNWKPKIEFNDLVKKMVLHDMSLNIC